MSWRLSSASSQATLLSAYSQAVSRRARAAAWSDLGFLNYTRAHYEHYADLLEAYPEYQLCLVDEDTGYPVGRKAMREAGG